VDRVLGRFWSGNGPGPGEYCVAGWYSSAFGPGLGDIADKTERETMAGLTDPLAVPSDDLISLTDPTAVASDDLFSSTDPTAVASDDLFSSTGPSAVASNDLFSSTDPSAVASDDLFSSTDPSEDLFSAASASFQI
jgi:hypothetical protein